MRVLLGGANQEKHFDGEMKLPENRGKNVSTLLEAAPLVASRTWACYLCRRIRDYREK